MPTALSTGSPTCDKESVGPMDDPSKRSLSSTAPFLARSALENLPAEIRNKIFNYVCIVPEDEYYLDGAVSVWSFPGITGTNKRLRAETLPVWFGNNDFKTYVDWPSPHSDLLLWLKALAGRQHVHGTLRIECLKGEKIVNKKSAWNSHKDCWFKENVDDWNKLVVMLKSAGLEAEQITWPRLPERSYKHYITETEVTPVLEQWLLDRYILNPLLRKHNFFDPKTRPVDMWQVMYGRDVGTMAVAPKMAVLWNEVFAQEKRRCVGDPAKWMEGWERREMRREKWEKVWGEVRALVWR